MPLLTSPHTLSSLPCPSSPHFSRLWRLALPEHFFCSTGASSPAFSPDDFLKMQPSCVDPARVTVIHSSAAGACPGSGQTFFEEKILAPYSLPTCGYEWAFLTRKQWYVIWSSPEEAQVCACVSLCERAYFRFYLEYMHGCGVLSSHCY